jgi:hypothetical protein
MMMTHLLAGKSSDVGVNELQTLDYFSQEKLFDLRTYTSDYDLISPFQPHLFDSARLDDSS